MLEKAKIMRDLIQLNDGKLCCIIIIVIAGACIERAIFIISELLTNDCFGK